VRVQVVRSFILIVMYAALIGSANAQSADSGQNSANTNVRESTLSDNWVLPRLSEVERKARIDFFLKAKKFKLRDSKSNDTLLRCERLLNSLRSGKYDVLNPVAYSLDNPKIQSELFSNCPKGGYPNLTKIYFPTGRKENIIYYSAPSFNQEFYDFSHILNKPIFGFFAEGGQAECVEKLDGSCSEVINKYNTATYTLGSVFDKDTCEVKIEPKYFISPRLVPHTIIKSSGQTYRGFLETPTVYAFIRVTGDVSMLALTIRDFWQNFSEVLGEQGASLTLKSVSTGEICSYQTKEYFTE